MTLIKPIRKLVTSSFSGRADTEAYIDRVETDGGEVIDPNWIDDCFQWRDDNGDFGNSDYAWISAGGGVKKDGSNKVIKMYSLSGAAWDVEQTTAGNRPTWTDNYINGEPSIVFVSSNSEHLDDVSAQNFLGQRNRFLVVGAATGQGDFFDGNSRFSRGASDFELNAGSTWGPASADSDNHIFKMEFGGSNSKFYLDSGSVISGNPGTGHFNWVRIGNGLDGHIAELMFGDDVPITAFTLTQFLEGRYDVY